MHVRYLPAPLGLALTALLLVSCGGSPTSPSSGAAAGGGDSAAAKKAQKVYNRFNNMDGDTRKRALVKAAEAEGEVSVYTSTTDEMDRIAEAFENTYDIDVSVYRANSETVLQRVLQEQRAGYFGADVVETNAGELNVLNKQGMFADYQSHLRAKVREEGQLDGWTATRFNVFVIGWNTNQLNHSERPRSLAELAEPQWRGKVSMEIGDVDWFAAMYRYYRQQGKTDAQTKELFSDLAANSKVVKGHTVQGEMLSAGQFAATVSSYSHTIEKAAENGAPVTWRPDRGEPVQPVVIRPNGIGLMKAAQHPAAALLFTDFMLEEKAQNILADAGRVGSVPAGGDPLVSLQTISVPDDELLAHPKRWDRLYESVIKKGQQVK